MQKERWLVVDLDFGDFEASCATQQDDWTEDAKAGVERVLNSTRIPALVAASHARVAARRARRARGAARQRRTYVLARRASYAAGAAPRALQLWSEE